MRDRRREGHGGRAAVTRGRATISRMAIPSRFLLAFALLSLGPLACAEAGPISASLAPLAEPAVEAVMKAARAQGRAVAPEVLAAAQALDKAHEASEAARDKQLRLILAAVRRKPVAATVAPAVVVAPMVADAGAEGGR